MLETETLLGPGTADLQGGKRYLKITTFLL
jgi:hypothetical protein